MIEHVALSPNLAWDSHEVNQTDVEVLTRPDIGEYTDDGALMDALLSGSAERVTSLAGFAIGRGCQARVYPVKGSDLVLRVNYDGTEKGRAQTMANAAFEDINDPTEFLTPAYLAHVSVPGTARSRWSPRKETTGISLMTRVPGKQLMKFNRFDTDGRGRRVNKVIRGAYAHVRDMQREAGLKIIDSHDLGNPHNILVEGDLEDGKKHLIDLQPSLRYEVNPEDIELGDSRFLNYPGVQSKFLYKGRRGHVRGKVL